MRLGASGRRAFPERPEPSRSRPGGRQSETARRLGGGPSHALCYSWAIRMTTPAARPEPILCAHLLRKVDDKLIELLRSLGPAEWDLQTVAPLWRVRDVAAHLLDTALRKLSLVRDSCYVETANVRSQQDVVT